MIKMPRNFVGGSFLINPLEYLRNRGVRFRL